MVTAINVSGNAENKSSDFSTLSACICEIIQAGGDREVTLKALDTFAAATQLHTTIQNCDFTVRDNAQE